VRQAVLPVGVEWTGYFVTNPNLSIHSHGAPVNEQSRFPETRQPSSSLLPERPCGPRQLSKARGLSTCPRTFFKTSIPPFVSKCISIHTRTRLHRVSRNIRQRAQLIVELLSVRRIIHQVPGSVIFPDEQDASRHPSPFVIFRSCKLSPHYTQWGNLHTAPVGGPNCPPWITRIDAPRGLHLRGLCYGGWNSALFASS
jgi:hypothetical protein